MMSAKQKSSVARPKSTPNTLSPHDVDLNVSRLSAISHGSGSTVVLGGTQYPVGTRIGSSGMFVIADPLTDFNPKGPDSIYSSQTGLSPETGSVGSLSTSFMQVRGAYPIRERGYGFEEWNWTVIRYICMVLVIALMVILVAATIGLTVRHNNDCDITFKGWEGSSVYRVQAPIFHDSDDNDVGDLTGVGGKVDYLTYLGVNIVLLSDFLPAVSPFFDNLKSFTDVDRRVGRLNDMIEMVRALNKRHVRVLLEISLATTSNEHVWFLESREQSAVTGNNLKDFYIWDSLPDDPLNKGKWEHDPIRSQYYHHRNDSTRPVLNWKNDLVWDAVEQVLRHWLDRGVDGFLIRGFKDFYVDSDWDVEAILSRMRSQLNSYPSRKLLILEGEYLEKVAKLDEEMLEDILRHVDAVEMEVAVTTNTTYKLQWDVEQSLKWQKRRGGPQTLWKLKHYTSIEKQFVPAVQMYLGMLPGNPSFQAGDEIGVHYDVLEDNKYKPMLWQSNNIYPYLPSSSLDSTTIDSLRGTLRTRQDNYALRKDVLKEPGKNRDREINMKFLHVDKESMLVERKFHREDSYYYAVNMNKEDSIERDWVEKVRKKYGDIVADARGEMSGFTRLESLKLKPAQSIVFKVIR